MPITLSVTGRIATPGGRLGRAEAREWLARAAVWFEALGDVVLDAHVVLDPDGKPVLVVALHPAPPPVEIRLYSSGKVRADAVTGPAGPGYHSYLCGLLRQLSDDFGVRWDPPDGPGDPAGYFGTPDRSALERHFLRWLSSSCATAAGRLPGPVPVHLGLSKSHRFRYPAPVLTPVGPRDRDWLSRVAVDPSVGRDFFAWWCPDPDAAFYRNRAVVRLWCDFPWRPPLTEAEGELTDQIGNDLATAFKLDPMIELPWNEWLEVLAAVDGDREGFTVTPNDMALSVELWKRAGPVPPRPGVPPAGYRRYPVRENLCGGWSVEVPGNFAREWDDGRTWTAWDDTRTVWFHALGYSKPDGEPPTADEALDVGRRSLPKGEELPPWERDGVVGEAVFGPHDDDGRTVWRLSGLAATAGRLVVCNVYVADEKARGWAVETWKSLRHEPPVG